MKPKSPSALRFAVVNAYANDYVVSRHRTYEAAYEALTRIARRFERDNRVDGGSFTAPVCPYEIKSI